MAGSVAVWMLRCVGQLFLVLVLVSSSHGFDPSLSRGGKEEVEERECVGTASGFSSSGTAEFHYNLLRKRYLGCTYVLGNLEITHLVSPNINYDLSFLRHIRYVSGYVLIGLVSEVRGIPLTNLEIIRGNHTFDLQGQSYSLMVALTARADSEGAHNNGGDPHYGLTELMMPRLKEITRGKVTFIQNPSLGYVDTINWDRIVQGRLDSVHFGQQPFNASVSIQMGPEMCNGGGMWGKDASLCQQIESSPAECDKQCGSPLCYGPSTEQCCDQTCAIGCTGPTSKQCLSCKDFSFQGKCVSHCPDMSYQLMQQCIQYEPLNPLD